MSDDTYTPTTESVFKNLAGLSDDDVVRRAFAKAPANLTPYPWSDYAAAKYDRWLAAHDAHVAGVARREALNEAAAIAWKTGYAGDTHRHIRDKLLALAALSVPDIKENEH